MTKSAIAVCMVVAVWVAGTGLTARAQNTDTNQFGTGLKPMTPKEMTTLRKMFPKAVRIRPNRRALGLINQDRKGRGLSELTEAAAGVVPAGQEAVLETEAGTATAEILSSGGAELFWAPPGDVDNSKEIWFPPIRSQGSIGSCTSWGITYYQHTYETARLLNRNAKSGNNDYIFSPKWTYNMVNDGVDNGSNMSETFDILVKHGSANWNQFPYDSSYKQWCLDPDTWKTALQWRLASRTGIYSLSTTNGLAQLRQALANGYVCTFATYVTSWTSTTISNDPSTTNDDIYVNQRICPYMNGSVGGHIMTFVGYSDSIWCDINGNGTVDEYETGAFKLANSWGTGDWNSGYRWVSYDAFAPVSRVAGAVQSGRTTLCQSDCAYYTTVQVHSPKLYAKFTVNHAKRAQMYMDIGLSSTSATNPASIWTPNALTYDGGNLAFDGSTTARDGTFVLDFTDLNPPMGSAQRYWFRGYDSTAGDPLTIKAFSLVDVWEQEYPADPANFVPANGIVDSGVVTPGKVWVNYSCSTNPPEPVLVRAAVADADGSELGADPATFTVTRVDPLTGAGLTAGTLDVHFTMSGTAAPGSDYSNVGTNVTILDGASNAVVTIDPLQDTAVEGSETVTLTLAGRPGSYFAMGSCNSATATLYDDDSRLTIAATDSSASEVGPNTGTYTLTRNGGTDGDLTVYCSVDPASTAATNDYTALPGSVAFSHRQATRTVTLTPVNDSIPELDETVILRVDAGASYVVGSPSSATVIIAYNDNSAPTVSIVSPQVGHVLATGETVTVVLQAVMGDDGNPSNALAATWSRLSGPDAVSFGNANATNTTVTLSEPGSYVLQIEASDGWTQAYDRVAITLSTNLALDTYGGPANGLALWFKLDDGSGSTALDSSGSGRNGAVQGGAAWTNGQIRGGLYFADTDDKVIVNPACSMGANWTIATWFTAPLPATASWHTLTRGYSADHHVILDSSLQLGTYVGSFYGCGYNLGGLSSGWHHLAAVGSGTSTLFYVDGEYVGTSYKKTANDVYCVGNYQSNSQRFAERLDDVRLYTRVLSTNEILDIINRVENVAPVTDAGGDQQTTTALPIALHGVSRDDGLPASPGSVASLWTRISGPGSVDFSPNDEAETVASCSAGGTHVLRLTSSDGQVMTCDEMILDVTLALPGITLVPTGDGTEVREHSGGSSDTYKVRLNTEPTASVTVTLTNDASQLTVSPSLMTFDAGDWSVAKTVTVTAVDDALAEGLHGCSVGHVAASGDLNYSGRFTNLWVVIVDNDVNNPPVAVPDACALVEDCVATGIAVRSNDSDVDGDALSVVQVGVAAHGTTAVTGGGAGVSYKPVANFNGADAFSYVISDGRGGLATGTVSVTVSPVNDAPVAWNDAATLAEDSSATAIAVRANDSDVDGDILRIGSVTQGGHGTVVITGGGSGLTYQPAANFNGSDVFTYGITDDHGGWDTGSVVITVSPANDTPSAQAQSLSTFEGAPLAMMLGGSDVDGDTLSYQVMSGPSHGTLQGTAPALVYQPAAGYSGSDSFTFRVNDGHVNSANATINLTVVDAFVVSINFQPAASPVPSGFLADSGSIYGDRANGYTYGWRVANTANMHVEGLHTNVGYDTYAIMNEGNNATQWEAPWEIAVPRSIYTVRVVAGNPADVSSTHSISVEGQSSLLGTATPGNPFVDATFAGIDVQDGRLTLDNGGGQNPTRNANAICFVEISNATNCAPAVQAGVDRTVTTNSVSLDGTVADDGLPEGGAVSVVWTKVSGPGSVTFASSNSVDTVVTFGQTGSYVLRLSAGDSVLNGQDTVSIAYELDTDHDGIPNSIDADDDNDGLPDTWEIANGLDPLTSDADTDSDADGLSNLQEYIAGTCPTNAHSCLELQMISVLEDPTVLFQTATGRLYWVDYVLDLSGPPTWEVMATNLVGDGGLLWLSHSNRADRSFYRIHVRQGP